MTSDYEYLFDYKMRMAEAQDIAAMDRLAAELQPQSVLSRWVERRATQRGLGRPRPARLARRSQARHAA